MMELTVNEAMDLVQESNLFESPKRAVLRLLEELQSRRAAEREQTASEANTKSLGWVDRLLEDWEKGYENAVDGSVSKTNAAWYINRLREAYSEQAAPEPRKPDFVGVDMASEPDRTEVRVIRLQKRPKWLRDLLSQWERRACDLIAHGRYWDGQYLRARAEEIRKVHDERPRKPAKWERRMKEMGCLAWLTFDDVSDPPQWKVIWQEKRKGKIFCAATAKAAVKAAWRAWKEARRDA